LEDEGADGDGLVEEGWRSLIAFPTETQSKYIIMISLIA
jgi:hypothetical protein